MESRIETDDAGTIHYYDINDKFKHHREDGPAVIMIDGTKVWCYNNQWHREDGPAIERPDGSPVCWYIHGKEYNDKNINEAPLKLFLTYCRYKI